jgi:hypothetical protein
MITQKVITTPCPICGVPACGKEYMLVVKNHEEQAELKFNGHVLDRAIDDYLKIQNCDYKTLPLFIKQWNEDTGWADCEEENGYALDVEDFEKAVCLLKESSEYSSYMNEIEELLEEIKNIFGNESDVISLVIRV